MQFFRYNLIIIFWFHRKVKFHSWNITFFCIFFNDSIIFESSNVMLSFSTYARKHFWIYQLNHKLFEHETCPSNSNDLEDWVLNGDPFWFTNLLQLLKNQSWYGFEDAFWDNKKSKTYLLKTSILHYTLILSKSWKSQELISRQHSRDKNVLEMCYRLF